MKQKIKKPVKQETINDFSKEYLEAFAFDGELIGVMEKKEMHKKMQEEYFKKGKCSIRHKNVKLMLLTSQGRLILQRRSKWKGENSGMWDKTIGGHVTSDDSYDLTMLKECAEELGIPSTIVKKEEFLHAISITDLNVLGVITKLTLLDNFQSTRKLKDGRSWVESSKTQFYIGYYDGPIRFIDSESCGIQVFTLEELEDEIKNQKELFTDDVSYFIKKFRKEIKAVDYKHKHILNY